MNTIFVFKTSLDIFVFEHYRRIQDINKLYQQFWNTISVFKTVFDYLCTGY